MPDIVVDLSDEEFNRIDAQAKRMGMSRVEFIRREANREAIRMEKAVNSRPVTVEDFKRFSDLAKDMMEPDFEQRVLS